MLEITTDLVFKFLAEDRSAATTGPCGISALYHEVGNDAVEDCAVVVLARRERGKVLAGLWCM